MTRAELRDVIRAVLGEIAPEADLAALDPAADLRAALDLDSVDFLNFVLGLHRTTGVDVPEADYPKLATLDGAVAYLAGRLTAGPAGAG